MHRVIFLGPPGSGKGTQAPEVARRLGVPHLSTGDLLRSAVAAGSALGREADRHMREGHLVPDELVLRVLEERLKSPDTRNGFVLDGYPRNVAQAKALERFTPVDAAILLEIPEEQLVQRLTERRSCPRCGRVYNLTTRPSKRPGRCDEDGTSLVQRPDDQPEAVRTRLEVYRAQTAPLVEHYRAHGLLRPVDATGRPDEVRQRVEAVLGGAPRSGAIAPGP